MPGQKPRWGSWLRVWSAWLLVAAPGICSSFSGVVLTDVGSPVPGATVIWNNQGVCTLDPDGSPNCSPPTVSGSTTTGSDGSFAALNLPAGTYSLCTYPNGGNLLDSCTWPVAGSTSTVTLANNQDLTGLLIFLQSGSLVVITVRDPLNALSTNFFLPSVVVGTGAFYRATYDPNRHAYTSLILEGIPAQLFFDTLLVVQDQDGNSVPIDTAVLPFTTGAREVSLTVSVMPDLVNAASYLPGVTSGTIATLFGSEFTDIPGIQVASGFPLPTQLSGTSVKVNGISAPLFAVAEQDGHGQINFQVPHFPTLAGELAAQDFTIVVDNNGKEQTFYVRNWPGQVGVFKTLAHLNGDPITASSPARPGEQITIYWTEIDGYDFVYSPGVFVIPDGIPSPPSVPCVSYADPQVKIGGVAADVGSCSAAPGLVGIGQLVVTVPLDLASGDYDVAVTLESVEGNIVRLPVRVP
jgi:uncharacterized protein (TIGR03437 family)